MAGIITIAPGHDASYPWRQIGTSAQPAEAMPQPAERSPEPGVAYYLSPAEKGGEPPGRWRGAGLAELGFQDGQVIDRPVFEQLYGQFLDPRDPGGETRLGRSPPRFRSAEDIYAGLIALEPCTTAERRAELMAEAKNQVRLPVQYFDVTFSVSKSITLLHASALANAAQAVWASIEAGNKAALDYLQREAGYTRSGYHGRQVNGVTSGRWEDAHRFVIGSFSQHTSRDGDPQLHIHNLVLNRVQRERDGAWRTLDSRGLFEHRGAASAIAAVVMESALSRRFGVGWTQRADGHGREIAGVSRELMEQFSARRQSISALTERLARQFEEQHGYPPDARALGQLHQWANHATRARKGGARNAASATTMAMFLAMEARAHAGNNDDAACSRALGEAERFFEKGDAGDDPAWIRYFDAAELAGEGAHCFRDLRSPRTAQEFVTRAIELTDPSYVRTLAFVRLVHAASYVQQREPGQAVEVARGAIALAGSLKSHRYLRYIRDLSDELVLYDAEPEVREFNQFVAEKYPNLTGC